MWVKKRFHQLRKRLFRKDTDDDHSPLDHHSTPTVQILSRRCPTTRPLDSFNDQDEDVGSTLSMMFHLTKSGCWRTVISRCETHPEEASTLHQDPATGNNMLHYVAYNRGPAEAAESLIKLNPSLVRSWNKNGSLPLHVACSYSNSPELIDALIQAYPEGAYKTNHHRHFFHSSADSFLRGYTPIHILCETGRCNVQLFEKLVPAGIGTINDKDPFHQRTPLASWNSRKNLRLDQKHRNHMRRIVQVLNNLKENSENENKNDFRQMKDDMELYRTADFWQVASLLIVASFEKESFYLPITPSRVLRATVGNPDCPPSMTEYAMLVHHEYLVEQDVENGQTPLHVACSSERVMTSVVLDLLHACPQACQIRDKQGHFPLWYAVQRSDPSWAFRLVDWFHANPQAAAELPAYHSFLLPHILHSLRYYPSHAYELLRGSPPNCENLLSASI